MDRVRLVSGDMMPLLKTITVNFGVSSTKVALRRQMLSNDLSICLLTGLGLQRV